MHGCGLWVSVHESGSTPVVAYIESGHVMLPENAPFTNDFIAECEAFTADDSHLHDDQVDPMIDAIIEMLATMSTVEIWSRML